ncbi:MAG: rhodanese-like domain-containing protein [Saprospiraceae bacterium]
MLKTLLGHTVPELGVAKVAPKASDFVWLDAREPKEYQVSHIKGAQLVGYDHFDIEALPEGLSKDQPIVVYCSVGYRSEKVAEKLRAAGFTRVSNLYGGIFEWVNQGHPVYKGEQKTAKVHAYDKKWGVWLKKGEKVY